VEWGPYFDALFPPQEVSPWIAWKIRSTGVGVAKRLWDQREHGLAVLQQGAARQSASRDNGGVQAGDGAVPSAAGTQLSIPAGRGHHPPDL